MGTRVFSFTRTAVDKKQTLAPRGILRVRWFIALSEGPGWNRHSVWRSWNLLPAETLMAAAFSVGEFSLGRAAGNARRFHLVWTGHRPKRLDVYRRVLYPPSLRALHLEQVSPSTAVLLLSCNYPDACASVDGALDHCAGEGEELGVAWKGCDEYRASFRARVVVDADSVLLVFELKVAGVYIAGVAGSGVVSS